MSTSARMNMTTTAPKTDSSYPDDANRIMQIVVTILIFLVGVSLNSLVVWILGVRGYQRRRRGSGETQGAVSFRIYVVNLALADLVLLLRTPLMVPYLVNKFNWTLGELTCKLTMYLRCLGLYASSFLLCAVAVERCCCLLRPVWARLKRPHWTVPVVCAAIWTLAASLAVPYIRGTNLIIHENRTACSDYATGTPLIVVETVAGFLLPLVIFLFCNSAVIICAKKAEHGVGTQLPSSPTTLSGPGYTSQRLARLYRVLLLTIILFLTCWVPYFTCRFLRGLSQSHDEWKDLYKRAYAGVYVSLYLVYLKSALNPIMYVFAARGLGRTVRASLLSTIERIFNDDTSESLRRKSLRRRDSQI